MERFRQFLEGAARLPVIGAANATAVAGGIRALLSAAT